MTETYNLTHRNAIRASSLSLLKYETDPEVLLLQADLCRGLGMKDYEQLLTFKAESNDIYLRLLVSKIEMERNDFRIDDVRVFANKCIDAGLDGYAATLNSVARDLERVNEFIGRLESRGVYPGVRVYHLRMHEEYYLNEIVRGRRYQLIRISPHRGYAIAEFDPEELEVVSEDKVQDRIARIEDLRSDGLHEGVTVMYEGYCVKFLEQMDEYPDLLAVLTDKGRLYVDPFHIELLQGQVGSV